MKNDICFVISSVSLSSHVETITRWAQTQRRRHVFSNRVLSIVERSGPGLKCEEQKILLSLLLLTVYKFTEQNNSSMNDSNHSAINLQHFLKRKFKVFCLWSSKYVLCRTDLWDLISWIWTAEMCCLPLVLILL